MDLHQSTHNSLVLVVLLEATVRFCFHVQLDLLRLVDSVPSELRAQDIWRSDLDDEKGQLEYILNGENPISQEGEKCSPSRDVPLVRVSLPNSREDAGRKCWSSRVGSLS